MEQDNTAIGLGIPYLILIFLTWINAASYRGTYPYVPWVYEHWGGLLTLIGCLFMIPVFILTIIFITRGEDSCENAAFGLALPGWFLIIIGAIIGLYYTASSYLVPTMFFIFVCPQIILGFGLFARRKYTQVSMRQTPPQRPYSRAPQRRPRHLQRSVPSQTVPSRHGSITIPNEVRLASTMGQTIKQCVRCRQNLDSKTQVCYFCGARQPPGTTRTPPQRHAPAQRPSSTQRPRAPQRTHQEEFHFCPSCGTKVRRGHLFCTQCGASLD